MPSKSLRMKKTWVYPAFVFLGLILLAFVLYKVSVKESLNGNLDIANPVQFNSTISSNPKTVAFFYMPGCGHCKDMDPVFDKVASDSKFSNVKFVKVNGTKYGDLASQYDVSGFPTIIRFNDGKTSDKDKQVGASGETALRKFCRF